jgi:cytochrome c oxidase cbb3-type subunit 4
MISGLFTAMALLCFGGVSWWAYTGHNRARFAQAARLPLDDGEATAEDRS